MSSYLRVARALLSCLAPLTGTRATGAVTAKATSGTASILAKRPVYGAAVRGGQLDYGTVVKTVGDASVTTTGTAVQVVALSGGPQGNVPTGTTIRWEPQVSGLAETAVVTSPGLAGGVAPSAFGALRQVRFYEQIGPADVARDLFAAKVGLFPAAVLSWDGGAALERVGRSARVMEDRWLLALIASRQEGDERRRAELLQVLDDVVDTLTDRSEVDGEVFSAPAPVTIGALRRVAIDPGSYVYAVGLTTERAIERKEWRTFNDWLRTRIDVDTQTTPAAAIVDDNRLNMPT